MADRSGDRRALEAEYRLRTKDGSYRWFIGRALPVRNGDGEIERWYGTCTDVDDLKRSEESRELLARELSHRIKNIFAVVGGLAASSARGHPEAASFAQDFRERVNALAQAHEYVRPHSPDDAPALAGETVQGLMRVLFAPYLQKGGERISMAGDDVPIGPASATALALVLHEQATNAVKYGALSNEGGQVRLTGKREDGSYVLTWQERGGPPVNEPPERKGFGTQMTARSVVGQLGGSLTYDWARRASRCAWAFRLLTSCGRGIVGICRDHPPRSRSTPYGNVTATIEREQTRLWCQTRPFLTGLQREARHRSALITVWLQVRTLPGQLPPSKSAHRTAEPRRLTGGRACPLHHVRMAAIGYSMLPIYRSFSLMSLLLGLVLVAFTPAWSVAQELPPLPRNMPYQQARRVLVHMGYTPAVVQQRSQKCSAERSEICRAYTEAEHCADALPSRCSFLWNREESVIEVTTTGQMDLMVDRVRCRSGCAEP